MINTNSDEGALFILQAAPEIYKKGHDSYIKRLLGYISDTELEELKMLYTESNANFSDNFNGIINILSDYTVQCPGIKMAKAYSDKGLPVVKSYFAQRMAIFQLPFYKVPPAHGMYLQLIIGISHSGGNLIHYCLERKEI
jgi:carboxylesterase type B